MFALLVCTHVSICNKAHAAHQHCNMNTPLSLPSTSSIMLWLPALQAEVDFTPCLIPHDQTIHMHAVAFRIHILHVPSTQNKPNTCCGFQVYEQVTQSRNRLSTRLSAANKVTTSCCAE
jgi:hypothetical protein